MSEWSESRAFGELRSLANAPPGRRRFASMRRLVDEAEEAAPGSYAGRWSEWLSSSIEGWSSRELSIRVESIEEARAAARAPWRELVAGVELHGLSLADRAVASWVRLDMRDAFPRMKHLGLSRVALRKGEVEKLCQEGGFDELNSLSIESCGLRRATFLALMRHLEARDELDHLRIASSGAPSFLSELLVSPLLERLVSFGLPGHQALKDRHVAQLVEHAPRMARVEALDLRECALGSAGARALAGGEWSDTLEHVCLGGNAIRGTGVRAFVEQGRGAWLVSGDGVLRLNQSAMGKRALEELVGAKALEGVRALDLTWCGLSSLEPLLGVEDLSRLTHLRAGGDETTRGASAFVELLKRATAMVSFVVSSSGYEGWMSSILELPVARTLERLEFAPARVTPDGLVALLDWERLGDGVQVIASCDASREHELFERIQRSRFGYLRALDDLGKEWRMQVSSSRMRMLSEWPHD